MSGVPPGGLPPNALRSVDIPSLVRIKPGALDRIGLYLSQHGFAHAALFYSEGLPELLVERAESSLRAEGVAVLGRLEVRNNGVEEAQRIFAESPGRVEALIGLGGGKALDVAKYVGFLLQKPFYSLPASLSNDGFSSPQSSLTVGGARRSLPSRMPYGVVVDTDVCLAAPELLWLSGVGDLVAKITAVEDWKLAFHADGTYVDDFAALLSDSTVFQFMARPERDLEGIRLLANALMLNGIAMAVCGSSRPASGGEHLISHALDAHSARPRLHGLQVGTATYLVAHLQDRTDHGAIGRVLEQTGFWDAIARDPFIREEWIEAIRVAPTLKRDFHTVLSGRDRLDQLLAVIDTDPRLAGCFV
ncbi:MAG: iron-containing alcohol dehydrogenase family protein [Acidimicrobiia bacterium]|nr:iron-containing alcohol dehydrogenase family protein [Acidimicrobiia bacterium]